MTTEKPILFSAPMVRSILEGRKTQTRRLVKPQPGSEINPVQVEDCWQWATVESRRRCPYGAAGDRLWVRETWAHDPMDRPTALDPCLLYVATASPDDLADMRRRPSIFMPRWASRITLEICSVRVERLCDISEADALAEGISWPDRNGMAYRPPIDLAGVSDVRFAADRYRELWESIHGPGSWELSPWCWVISFRRVAGE